MGNQIIGKSADYHILLESIGATITNTRNSVARNVNSDLLRMNWEIGRYIVEFEQNGTVRAEYGSQLLLQLSRGLRRTYGEGYSRSNLQNMRKLYLAYPKCQTLSGELSWSHYLELLKADDPLEISFYTHQCEREHWTVRELRRQMESMLFHRIAVSKNAEMVLKLAKEGQDVQRPEDLIHDPFVLEFANLPLPRTYKDELLMEYALEGLSNQLFAAKYQLYLPNREELQHRLNRLLDSGSLNNSYNQE